MLKKIMATTTLALVCVFAVSASDTVRPSLEFVKNGQVIESRQMNDKEYQVYQQLRQYEAELETLQEPLSQLETEIETQAELIEQQVGVILRHAFAERQDQSGYERELEVQEKEQAVEAMRRLTSEMAPTIDQIKGLAHEIKWSAHYFRDSVQQNYGKDEVDSIRIIGGDGRQLFRFDGIDTPIPDVDIDLNFDI